MATGGKAAQNGARTQKMQVIACPWHNYGNGEHPGGAPECSVPSTDISVGRVVPLGDLIAWLTIVVTQQAQVTNTIWNVIAAIDPDALEEQAVVTGVVEALEQIADELPDPGIGDSVPFYASKLEVAE